MTDNFWLSVYKFQTMSAGIAIMRVAAGLVKGSGMPAMPLSVTPKRYSTLAAFAAKCAKVHLTHEFGEHFAYSNI